ncbi:MAG: ImmA/IrrE family metallo-endopeptidase [Candidatus Altiarchaeota archaeon]
MTLEQAQQLIVKRAKEVVSQLINRRGHDRPPFTPQEYSPLVGISKIEKADLGDVGAVLLRFYDKTVVRTNKNDSRLRQNFSFAHEIAHILYSELKLEQYTNSIEYRFPNVTDQERAKERDKERLCNIAATELLMPEEVFARYLTRAGLSIDSVKTMARLFEVSFQAAAIRIAEVSMEPCIMLLWRMNQRGKSRRLTLNWRVVPGTKPKARNNFMPVHNDCPSSVYEAFKSETTAKSYKLFKLDREIKRLPLESKGFGVEDNRYVISFAYPSRAS